MKIRHLIFWDIRLQARYGFYLLYGFLTVLYMIILYSMPQSWKVNASAILIFSDPAAMGMFFMGAIVLLEKSQRVNQSMAVSPVSAFEYVLSKVISLGLIALLVAMVLAVWANCKELHLILLGTSLSSILFTLAGMIIASKIVSLNQFMIATVPFEIIVFIPAILHLCGIMPATMRVYPPIVCMELVTGKMCSWLGLLITIIFMILMFFVACRCVVRMWQVEGGVKL